MTRSIDELPALVADVGGTNARFALATLGEHAQVRIGNVERLAAAAFPSLADAAVHYLRDLSPGERPRRAVFAVASAVATDEIRFTNSPWTFSVSRLQQQLDLDSLQVINDFAALSRSLPHLGVDNLQDLGGVWPSCTGQPPREAMYATIGPGTGLGVGGLLIHEHRPLVLESEGGHIGFSPSNELELEVLRVLLQDFPRVSNERLLCGPGMVNLHRALCRVNGVTAHEDTPEAITAGAAREPGGSCADTQRLFCALLGSAAGDVTLALGAWDGVFLGGGIALLLREQIAASDFRLRFEDKGRHAALMRTVPTRLITHPYAGLLGAAATAQLG